MMFIEVLNEEKYNLNDNDRYIIDIVINVLKSNNFDNTDELCDYLKTNYSELFPVSKKALIPDESDYVEWLRPDIADVYCDFLRDLDPEMYLYVLEFSLKLLASYMADRAVSLIKKIEKR